MVRKNTATESTRADTPEISVVIPVCNEEKNVALLTEELCHVLEENGRTFEIVFVDDGSRDGTEGELRRLAQQRSEITAVIFRKNFGKASALTAGFDHARGQLIITMDGDLQDNPNEIPRMLEHLAQGYDLVSGWKRNRKDPLSKTVPSRFFNLTNSLITGLRLHDFNCGFKIYTREVVDNLDIYGDLHRYTPALAHRKGFRVAELSVEHRARIHGKSKYGLNRFSRGVLDLITVFFLTRFARRPLHLFGGIGILFFLAGFVINTYLSIIWLQGRTIGHRPLLFLGILSIIVGIQMLTTGLLGEMMVNFIHRRERDFVIREVLE